MANSAPAKPSRGAPVRYGDSGARQTPATGTRGVSQPGTAGARTPGRARSRDRQGCRRPPGSLLQQGNARRRGTPRARPHGVGVAQPSTAPEALRIGSGPGGNGEQGHRHRLCRSPGGRSGQATEPQDPERRRGHQLATARPHSVAVEPESVGAGRRHIAPPWPEPFGPRRVGPEHSSARDADGRGQARRTSRAPSAQSASLGRDPAPSRGPPRSAAPSEDHESPKCSSPGRPTDPGPSGQGSYIAGTDGRAPSGGPGALQGPLLGPRRRPGRRRQTSSPPKVRRPGGRNLTG